MNKIFFVTSLILLMLFISPVFAEYSCYGWSKCINATLNTTWNTTNYTEFIDVPYDSDMKTDFSDLRVLNVPCGNTGAELGHAVEDKVDSSYVNLSVKVDAMDNLTDRVLGICYGRPSISSDASFSKAYPMFDDFEDNDVSDWVRTYGSATLSVVTSPVYAGTYAMKFNSDSNSHFTKNGTDDLNSSGGVVSGCKIYFIDGGAVSVYTGIGNSTPIGETGAIADLVLYWQWSGQLNVYDGGWVDTGLDFDGTQWFEYKYYVNQSGYQEKVEFSNSTWTGTHTFTTPQFVDINHAAPYISPQASGLVAVDNCFIRKYITPQPEYVLSSEQDLPSCLTPSGYNLIDGNTTICQGTYNISGNVFDINASNVTLDCNNSEFIGDNTGTFINILVGKQGIDIMNCGITNYSYSVYGGYYDNAGEIGARVHNFINNTIRNSPYSFFMGKVNSAGGESYFSYNHIYDTLSSPYDSMHGLWGSWDTWNQDNTTVSYNYLNNSNFVIGCPRSYLGFPYFQDYAGCIVDNNEIYNTGWSVPSVSFMRHNWGSIYSYGATFNNNIIRNGSSCGFYIFPLGYSSATHMFASSNNTVVDNGCGIATENYGNPMTWDGIFNSTIANNSGYDFDIWRGSLNLVNVTTDDSDVHVHGAASVYKEWFGYSIHVYGWNGTVPDANAYVVTPIQNLSIGVTDINGTTTYPSYIPQYYMNSTGRYDASVYVLKTGWVPNNQLALIVGNDVHQTIHMKMYVEPELYLNGIDDDAYTTIAYVLNVTSVLNGGLGNQSGFVLMLNGTPISNPFIGMLPATVYNYTSTFSENDDFESVIGFVTHYAFVSECYSDACSIISDTGRGIGGMFEAFANQLAFLMLIIGIVAGVLVIFYGVTMVFARLHG